MAKPGKGGQPRAGTSLPDRSRWPRPGVDPGASGRATLHPRARLPTSARGIKGSVMPSILKRLGGLHRTDFPAGARHRFRNKDDLVFLEDAFALLGR